MLSPATHSTRDSPRSINLPALVPHTPTYRHHKPLLPDPSTPDTPTTPSIDHASYFPSLSPYETYDPNFTPRKSPPRKRPPASFYPDSPTSSLPPYSLPDAPQTTMSSSAALKRKVVIMGSTSVGKTSLTQQYVAPPTYTASYYPTIEDTSHTTVKHNGVEYECEIVDSAGLEEYSLFPGKYAVGVHGYMLVYSITSRQSFEMVPTIYDKILDYAGLEKVPCVIVGQKTDLRDERSVTKEEGEALAKKLGAGFVESSAKDNSNVVVAFDVLLGEMQKVYNPAPEKKKSSWWSWGAK
ncbi:hypothetical protein IAT38_000488 [Cryptococcus sp. DSM 104549]